MRTTAIEFWNEITSNMKPWNEYLRGKAAYKLRQETIAVHDISLQALAILGSTLLDSYPDSWKEKIETLQQIDWSRENPEWDQRALFTGRLRKSFSNVVLTANLIKIKTNIPLTPKEQEYESRISG